MKRTAKITKKLIVLQLSSLTLLLIGIILINVHIRNENYIKLQERYMKSISHNITNQVLDKIKDIKIQLYYMGEDSKIEEYHNKKSEPILDSLLNKYKNISPLISYINQDGFETKRIINNKLSYKLSNFKKNRLYEKALKHPNNVINSKVKWNQDLQDYVIEFILFKKDSYNTILFFSIPVKELLTNIKLIDKTLTFRLVSNNKTIQFSSNKDEIGKKLNIKKQLNKETMIRVNIDKNDTFSYILPIENYSTIILTYNYNDFMKTPNKNIKLIFILVLIVISFTIIVTYKFSLNITKPLYTLGNLMELVAKGDYSKKIAIKSDDEIGTLANNFNSMIDKLKESQMEVQKKNIVLTKVNKELKEDEAKIKEMNENLTIQIEEAIKKNLIKDEQLLQQSKLAQMGDMVSMIAHQWRQPLNAISASSINLSLLSSMNSLKDSKLQEDSSFIQEQCQKMSKTIDTFMNFVKPSKESKQFYLQNTINSILNIMGSQLSNHNIEVKMEIIDKEVSVIGQEDLLEQVIINIISNARDAFENININNKFIKITITQIENKPLITIEDNAGGIAPDVREKIFNPYFTTKEQGKGTGIGLYMSIDIMQKSFHGDIVYSSVDNGSKFKIIFG